MRASFSLVSLALCFGFAAAAAIPAIDALGTVEGMSFDISNILLVEATMAHKGLVGNAGGLALRGSAPPIVARDSPKGDDGITGTVWGLIHEFHHGVRLI